MLMDLVKHCHFELTYPSQTDDETCLARPGWKNMCNVQSALGWLDPCIYIYIFGFWARNSGAGRRK